MRITFLGVLFLLDELFQKEILMRDVLIDGNMLVYRAASDNHPAGWYSTPIHEAAVELLHDKAGLDYLIEAAKKVQIDTEKCFASANAVLGILR